MKHLAIVFSGLLSVFVTASAAQEPKSRIDLDVVSNSIIGGIVVARDSFSETDSQCPEDRGTLRISGTLEWIRSSEDYPRPIISNGHATMQPSTDDTQQYRIETADCRMDIAIREQIRRDRSWELLVVPKQPNASLSPEESRRELQRQLELRAKNNPRLPEDWLDRLRAAATEMSAWSSSSGTVGGTVQQSFVFEEAPQTCFEAVGDFHIDRSGIRFAFLTHLPGDLNRFAIERTDLDMNRGRLYFTRGECRFELTVSQSVFRDGEWISVPLAPAPAPKE